MFAEQLSSGGHQKEPFWNKHVNWEKQITVALQGFSVFRQFSHFETDKFVRRWRSICDMPTRSSQKRVKQETACLWSLPARSLATRGTSTWPPSHLGRSSTRLGVGPTVRASLHGRKLVFAVVVVVVVVVVAVAVVAVVVAVVVVVIIVVVVVIIFIVVVRDARCHRGSGISARLTLPSFQDRREPDGRLSHATD
ncbi:unnamed protein product [Polarella glacialis]|uniref:Uncharacterized protein n=1 Tax=Polarella glacialis TaxID=89957 RepID=A0A813HXI8_POLGL|nr:unnamed protein product [Polarella glacialis]